MYPLCIGIEVRLTFFDNLIDILIDHSLDEHCILIAFCAVATKIFLLDRKHFYIMQAMPALSTCRRSCRKRKILFLWR